MNLLSAVLFVFYTACSVSCDLWSTLVSCSFTLYIIYVPFPLQFSLISPLTSFPVFMCPLRLTEPNSVSIDFFLLLIFSFPFFVSPLSVHHCLISPSLLPSPPPCFPLIFLLFSCISLFLFYFIFFVYFSFLFPLVLPSRPFPPFLCLSACRCRMCAATFFSKSDMQIHSKSHTEAKPHKCPHCAKSFANSSYLAQHIRIHSGAKPYTCSYCQKSFRQLSHLQQHTRYCRPPHLPRLFSPPVTNPLPYSLSS